MIDELENFFNLEMLEQDYPSSTISLKEGERRIVTILFAEIDGFVALSGKMDSEQVRVVLDKLFKVFTYHVEKYHGYVDKYSGESIMALFGAKQASEWDVECSLYVALKMVECLNQFNEILSKKTSQLSESLSIRIGINKGLVTTGRIGAGREGDYTVYGDAVNIASRLMNHAAPGHIFTTIDVRKTVQNQFVFIDKGQIVVKGKTAPLHVFNVTGIRSKPVPKGLKKSYNFIGRKSELGQLCEYLRKTEKRLEQSDVRISKKPLVIGMQGEAGIGKSRLIYEFLNHINRFRYVMHLFVPRITQAPYCLFSAMIKEHFSITSQDSNDEMRMKLEDGLKNLEIVCQDMISFDAHLPYLALILGIKDFTEQIDLKDRQLQLAIQLAIRTFIEALAYTLRQSRYPLMVIIEDLQWLDGASSVTLDYLMRTFNIDQKEGQHLLRNVFFLFSYRLDYTMSDSIRTTSDFFEMKISPLTSPDTRELIHSFPEYSENLRGMENILVQKSSGNPLYIEEWINLISSSKMKEIDSQISIPETIHKLVLSRIDKLDYSLKIFLQKAAVIGNNVDTLIIGAVERKLQSSDNFNNNMEELVQKGFFIKHRIDDITQYSFKHDIIREVAYNTLLISNRELIHHIVAQAIEEHYSDFLDQHAYELADHYYQARIIDKSIHYLETAAIRAMENFENERALRWFDNLLQLLAEKDENRRKATRIKLEKGKTLQLIGKWVDACSISMEALSEANVIDDKKLKGMAQLALGIINLNQGNFESAYHHFRDSIPLFESLNEVSLSSDAIRNLGHVAFRRGDYNQALACYEEKLKISRRLEDKRGILVVLSNIGNVHYVKGDHEAALDCFNKSIELGKEIKDKFLSSANYANMGNIYREQQDYDKAIDCYENYLKICQEIGNLHGISVAYGGLGNVYLELGDFSKAEIFFHDYQIFSEKLGNRLGLSIAIGNLGVIYLEKGDQQKALEYFYQRLQLCEQLGDKAGVAVTLGNLADAYYYLTDYSKALGYIDRSLNLSKQLGMLNEFTEFLFIKAKTLYELNRFEETETVIRTGFSQTEKLKKQQLLFKWRILSCKCAYVAEKKKSDFCDLAQLLNESTDKKLLADIHYELFIMNGQWTPHGIAARNLYMELYSITPRLEWKNKVKELNGFTKYRNEELIV
ncbi:tetratricopeptide repeat protein [candidate division CSSED10-310 bacterium]|uniref:Tetratricopeptide repeat protein n=1 Tax=candidate division CSSED10-310 bacterium TaxID=2855610 RepID=A0ABV6YX31_UNCC1